MATQVQLRRGTTAQNNAFTGAQGELSYDTTLKRLRIHDGATAGGFEILTENSSGDLLVDGTLGVTGVVTANAGVVVDNITIDGQEIDVSSGDLTLDVAGDIILDAAGTDVRLAKAGVQYGMFTTNATPLGFYIDAVIQDGDLFFRGNDGGSTITALTLDMSDAGTAFFNNAISMPNYIYHTGDGGTDTYFGFPSDNTVKFVTGNVESFVVSLSDVVVNDGGNDINFRIETTGNANMFYVDGGDDRVCIGTNSSGLNLASALGSSSLTVADGILFGTSANTTSYIGTGNTTGDIAIVANATPGNLGSTRTVRIKGGTSGGGGPSEIAAFDATSGAVFNIDRAAVLDFRVASGGFNHALFVDASADVLNIGTDNTSNDAGAGHKWHISSTQTTQYIVTNTASATNYPLGIYNEHATLNGTRFKLQVNGGLANFSANDVNLSDERMKENINLLADGALAKICAIPVKTFNYKDEPDGTDVNIGVIAQDVEAVAPELVDHEWGRGNDGVMADPFGDGVPLKSVFSDDIQYTMMKAIQELKTALDVATARITELEA